MTVSKGQCLRVKLRINWIYCDPDHSSRPMSEKKVDHDQRRLEVAVAAATIIADQGLEALTTRNLAMAMGCSIGVLSHYFLNKDEIVIAALNWADSRIEDRFTRLIEQSPIDVDQYLLIRVVDKVIQNFQ